MSINASGLDGHYCFVHCMELLLRQAILGPVLPSCKVLSAYESHFEHFSVTCNVLVAWSEIYAGSG